METSYFLMDGVFQNYSVQYNESLFNSSERTPIELSNAVVKGIVLGIICATTIVGNVLVLLAVFVNSHLRSTTNYFIVNLAIADLLLGTTVLPFSASIEVIDYWAFGQTFCDIWAAVDVMCCTASILSLCVISIDRYIGVTKPLQHSTIMTEKRALYIIIFVWFLSVIISVAPLIGWKEPADPDPTVCTVTEQIGYVLFSVSGSFYIPLLIILVVYFRIYKEAVKQYRFLSTGIKTSKIDESTEGVTLRIHTGRNTQTSSSNYQSSSSSEHSEGSGRRSVSRLTLAGKVAKFKRERKAAKTLGIVVGVFILSWFPFFFILPLGALCQTCDIPKLLFKIIFWLGYCNSMMNPIIYACSSKEFQRAFWRILRCQFRRRPRIFLNEQTASSTAELHAAVHSTTLTRTVSRRLSRANMSFRRKSEKADSRRQNSNNRKRSQRLTEESPLNQDICPESPIPSLMLFHKKRKELSRSGVSENEGSLQLSEDGSSDDEKSDTAQSSKFRDLSHRSVNKIFNGSSFADDEEYVNAVLVKSKEQLAIPLKSDLCLSVPKIIIHWDSESNVSRRDERFSRTRLTEHWSKDV